jgi:hypothetical protein
MKIAVTIVCLLLAGSSAAQSVEDLIAKNLAARGGAEKLRAIQTLSMTGAIGYLLWSENPRGPRVTKAYLVIGPFVVIVLQLFVLLVGVKVDLPRIVFGRLVYSVCWYAYLSTSVRVRQTYTPLQVPSSSPSPSFPEAALPSRWPEETILRTGKTPNSTL